MTDNVPIRISGCELCLYDDVEQYERDYIHKRKTVTEIVEDLNAQGVECNRYRFYNHIKHHLKPEIAIMFSGNADMLSKEIIDKVGELIEAIDRMKGKIQSLEHSINADADPSMIKAYTGLESEFRRLIETLAKISGDMKQSQTVNVANLNVEYNAVVDQVMQDACPVCKAKFAKTLEPLILKKDG